MSRIAEELRMTKPLQSLEQEAALSILRTAECVQQEGTNALRPLELTGAQFNVLRILRGSPDGLSCSQIAERLIQRDPDITRLLDRLESRTLISRQRSGQDRRVVTAKITAEGLHLLKCADPIILASHQHQFSGISETKLRLLIDLLEQVRCPVS